MRASGNEIFLIWGGNGWIAGGLLELLQKQGHTAHTTIVRMEDREAVLAELTRVKPTHVLNCAGVTGRPNVDWCETNHEATVRSNVIGTLNLADCCSQRGIHCTMYATGSRTAMASLLVPCSSIGPIHLAIPNSSKGQVLANPHHAGIYTYDAAHPMHSGIGFTETDTPNFSGSFYSFTKTHTESLLSAAYASNTLILRLRMPVSDDLHPRSFVTKISKYEHVVDIPNSNTILHDLLPCSITLALNNEVGVYNFTNPGSISHNEVLTLYERHVQPGFTWKNFSLEQQAKVIKADRSNCELDASKFVNKMREYGMEVPEVHAAYEQCFKRMAENLRAAGQQKNLGARALNQENTNISVSRGLKGNAFQTQDQKRGQELGQENVSKSAGIQAGNA